MFVEPPKDYWFVMGEYLPPPYGVLQLAAFLENKNSDTQIQVVDCNAEGLDWNGLKKRMEAFNPDVVASSALATCNTYVAVRTLELAKQVNPNVVTVTGGQHFTVLAEESLRTYPEIDVIVRGEGEETLSELTKMVAEGKPFSGVKGVSYRNNGQIRHNESRPLIENLDSLPFPGYKFVENLVQKYHFTGMAGNNRYALIEASRGCPHQCTFCTQWRHWESRWRLKSAKRVADEFEFCYNDYGSRFLWLTDDNYGLGKQANDLANELISRRFSDDMTWFMQVRCDDVVKHADVLPKMRKAGLRWVLLGVESNSSATLDTFQKQTTPDDAKKAIKLLKKNDIFSQGMFIIGQRKDTKQSIAGLRDYVNELDPDLAIFAILTPFPGTAVYQQAKQNGWIQDNNWANYDMVHAVMPTETLTTKEVQEELYNCYRSFFGSWNRRIGGVFSRKALKRRLYMYMASQGIVNQVKALF
ncbi:MAG: radical SAM protein [Candidatus Bathyarchaeia archaeon]|jgi:anaerobic magnesium-protoporphyrin IX monomethyl ester cyclase